MCNDGNSATQSVRYLNSQLAALFQNASECVQNCAPILDFKSVDYDKTKYTRSLAEFHFVGPKPKKVYSTSELFFSATFSQPKLTFICNHEAILYLTIKSGHFNLDHTKANVPGFRVETSKNKQIKDITVAFRMNFSRSCIKGGSSKIGNGSSHVIQLMVLDFGSAKLASFTPTQAHSQTEALSFYMNSYLDFLEHAGHHTLFDIPDFDDDKYSPVIDYSLSCTPQDVDRLCSAEVVHGIDLSQINNFMHKKWLSVARLGRPKDQLSACLAEISSSWLMNSAVDSKFHIQFGPPKVLALCKHEVILTFDVEKIAFFHSDDYESEEPEEYAHWKIAFVVDVTEEKEHEGCVTRLKLDLNTARFSHHFSKVSETTEFAIAHFYQIVHFLSVDYLDVLIQYAMHIIYHHDVRTITHPHKHDHPHSASESDCGSDAEEEKGEWGIVIEKEKKWHRRHGQVALWMERIEHTVLCGYDQVLAVSEESINQMFFSLWSKATRKDFDVLLSKWTLDMFTASFEALRVRLLTNGKAIIWVNVHEGQLRVKSESEKQKWWSVCEFSYAKSTDKTEVHNFSDLSLAFEVDLKMVEQKTMDLSESWLHRFTLSHLFQSHQGAPSRLFKHLILDFANAKYRPELSNVDCLCEGKGRMVVQKLETAISYIKDYLTDLSHHGHNVIHSVPLFTAGDHSSFGLTSVAHHIIAKSSITVDNCSHARKPHESPVILILGMCNFRELTFVPPQWNAGWVISGRGQSSLGTVCLSKSTFLEGVLLKRLATINSLTTIVPNFAGVIDGEWNFDLTTWAKHMFRKNRECHWTFTGHCDGALHYVWEHRDGWSHEHEGTSGAEKNGQYSIDCRTRNKLSIPTIYRPGLLEIVLHGESSLKISGKDANQSWSKKSSASWSANLCIYSRSNGLQIEVTGNTAPVFSDLHSEGECSIDVRGLHAQHLPKTVDFCDILDELKTILQGTWEYSSPGHFAYALSNPVFTINGDLILQLGSYDAIMKKELAPPIAVTGSPRSPHHKSRTELTVTTTKTTGGSGLEVTTSTKTVRKSRSILSRITSVKTSSLFNSSSSSSSTHESGQISSVSSDSPPLTTPLLDYTGTAVAQSTYFSKSLEGESIAALTQEGHAHVEEV